MLNRCRCGGQKKGISQVQLNEIIIDNFAGGGGASTAIELAGFKVDIAINHDPEAICMHMANHPDTKHYCEDVWSVNPHEAVAGRPVGLAWFSPDCKHFSKAKGGKPVEKKIRGLAWVVVRWAAAVRPRVIILENVEEFQTWGPLGLDNKPDKVSKGLTFQRWKKRLQDLGYVVDHRELKACDYGAPTIRKRLFLVARCDGQPIVWPEPTHGPGLIPYRTAAGCIDWSIPAPSIFERKRPLAENTLKRIAKGIKKFVIDAAEPFCITYYGPKSEDEFRGFGMGDQIPTQTTENRFGLVVPFITEHANASSQRNMPADEPLRTQCAQVKGGHFALVAPIIDRQFGQSKGNSVADPLGTTTADGLGKSALVTAFLAKHYTGVVGQSVEQPTGTVTTKDHHALVTSHLIKMRGTCRPGQDVRKPMPTITAGGLHVGEVRAFLIKYYGNEKDGCQLRDPLHTVTTKDRLGLVTVAGQDYQITDIGMRMLAPRELFKAQGFPESYIIDPLYNGKPMTKTAQVRMCGNSVSPNPAQALVEANYKQSTATSAVNWQ